MDPSLRQHHEFIQRLRRKQQADWDLQQRNIDYFIAKARRVFGREYIEIPKTEIPQKPSIDEEQERFTSSTSFEIRNIPSAREIGEMVQALNLTQACEDYDESKSVQEAQECMQRYYRFGER